MSEKILPASHTAISGLFGAARALSGAMVVCAGLMVLSSPTFAQDATWDVTPATNDFNTGANWTPNTVPTGVAFLSFSNTATLDFSADVTLDGITIGAIAPAYVLNNGGAAVNGVDITLTGAGITNGGDLTINLAGPNPVNRSLIQFSNSASAGSATINQNDGNSTVRFVDNSTAGNSTLTSLAGTVNSNAHGINFSGSSSAGSALITTGANGALSFAGTSTAGQATITNDGDTAFFTGTTAGSATITNNGDLGFGSTAANATITNNNGGAINFSAGSTAGNATFTNNAGGELRFNQSSLAGDANFTNSGLFYFSDTSDAQTAGITNNAGGTLWFNQTATANGAGIDNQNGGEVRFRNDSTAGSSAIFNQTGGLLSFYHDATAANAAIANLGGAVTEFKNNSNAGTAAIVNFITGEVEFEDDSSASSASITNAGLLTFFDSSVAANATITTTGATGFLATSSGGMSRQIVEAGGLVFINNLMSAGTTFGSIEGAGDIQIGAKTLTVGSLNTDTEFSGVIEDGGLTGSLIKEGTGALELSGVNTYTGDTTVNAGTLVVNGTVVSDVTVNGGTLMGTGDMNAATIGAGGVHAPGNSIGTQTVNGNYGNAGTLQIEADDQGNSDKVVVNGLVNIAGASLEIIELAGTWGAAGDAFSYVIIENDGNDAVAGLFGSVTNMLAFLTSTVVTNGGDGNDVVLTLTRNGVQFEEVAQTPNQKAVANALATGPLLTNDPDVNSALLGLSAEAARNAYDSMSGEVHASAAHAMSSHAKTLTGMAGERLWGVGSSGGAGGSSGPAMMGLTNSSMELHNNRAELAGRMSAGIYDDESEPEAPSLYQRFSMWVRGYGERSKINDDGNAAELDTRTGGVMGGGDVAISRDLRVGVLGSWGTTDGDVEARRSSFDMDTASVAAYAGYSAGPVLLKGLAGYSHHGIDTDRNISFGGINRNATADYDANQAILYGEAAYRMAVGNFGVMPLASLRWSRAKIDGFTENGAGPLNLTAQDSSHNRLDSVLGLRLATSYQSGGVTWLPQARIGWTHAFGDMRPDVDFAFQGGGDFTTFGVTHARNALTLGAGLNVTDGSGLTGFVDYSANLSKDGHDHAFSGGLRSEF